MKEETYKCDICGEKYAGEDFPYLGNNHSNSSDEEKSKLYDIVVSIFNEPENIKEMIDKHEESGRSDWSTRFTVCKKCKEKFEEKLPFPMEFDRLGNFSGINSC